MGYKELKVYQKAYENALEIHQVTLDFPKYEQNSLADQIRRASKSITLNMAEGHGRNGSVQDFKRFLVMALGSCEEVLVCLEYSKDLGYLDAAKYDHYEKEYTQIGKMLYGLHKNWRDIRTT